MNAEPAVFRSCVDCRWSQPLVPSGRLVCSEAHVNVPRGSLMAPGAYYAGNLTVLRSCTHERSLRTGACGQTARLWTPRPDDRVLGPAAGMDRLDV
jgi:hypothetical protein